MQKTLFEIVNEVQDEATFIAFLSALRKDRQAHADEWQQDSIDSFLEAAADWGRESVDGLKHYEKPDNPWKRCAQIMYMGKIYE
ncbi:DUF7660 family protein [Paenibacillus silvae]|uniref:DUF7660 family protein n=1 Tax=Paenibacillus silvae TaxID=1325358 RepID=UPI0020030409|nr:hypothetical protein [Paenibacillus silvae]MCK6074594.1 hypothetical protein [Paenibacillus silvae]MCK6147930.1 hypothetical protein [Paenibacillus silvae]MCK6266228.1 hypothetical protein [Paenibacillus silvae]